MGAKISSVEPQRGDSNNLSLKSRFRAAALQIRKLGAMGSYSLVPFRDPKLPWFSALNPEAQLAAVESLERSCAIYAGVDRKDFRNASAVVWAAFRQLGLVPPSDFFDKVESEDCIQVFSREHIHIFANFRFFELCSYTLEEVHCRPWNELWSRSEEALAQTFAVVNQALEPDQKATLMTGHIHHPVREVSSLFRFEFDYRLKCVAPLASKRDGESAGFIALEQAKITSVRDYAEEARILQEFTRLERDLDA